MVTKCANQSFTCRKTREAYTSKINWFLYDDNFDVYWVKSVFISDIERETTKWKCRDQVLVSLFKKC